MLVSITCLIFWLMNGFIHLWLKKFLNNWNRLSGRTILIDSIFRSSPRFSANTWQYIENSRIVSFDINFTRLGFENACWIAHQCRIVFENACWIAWLVRDWTCILEAEPGKLYIKTQNWTVTFYLSVYPSLQIGNYDLIIIFHIDSTSSFKKMQCHIDLINQWDKFQQQLSQFYNFIKS